MDSFSIKRGDTSPAIRRSFSTAAGPLEIPAGSTVVFSMAEAVTRRVVVSRGQCRIDGNDVIYFWQDEDTAVDGLYEAEFEITYPDGSVATAPNGGFLVVNITRDIA